MQFTIETLTLNDLHEFWLVFKEILETEFPGYSKDSLQTFLTKLYSEYSYRYFLENKMKTILVARGRGENASGNIVAFAVIDDPYGGVSLLRWLGVKKEFQRHGIGRRLIDEWLKLAAAQGCHKAEVASQPEAKEFYAKAGLELEGHRHKSYFGIDQYIYGKVLR